MSPQRYEPLAKKIRLSSAQTPTAGVFGYVLNTTTEYLLDGIRQRQIRIGRVLFEQIG